MVFLVDTRVELKKTLGDAVIDEDVCDEIKYKEINQLKSQSLNPELFLSFKRSRFYIDNKFNKDLVTKMYKIWVENHINAKNAKVIGAHMENKIIGLITYKFPSGDYGEIGLFSVKSNFGSLGIGSNLINRCIFDLEQKKKNIFDCSRTKFQ